MFTPCSSFTGADSSGRTSIPFFSSVSRRRTSTAFSIGTSWLWHKSRNLNQTSLLTEDVKAILWLDTFPPKRKEAPLSGSF